MADTVRNVPPDLIFQNPENPRLIFRESELKELEESIDHQGILVPLTVYEDKRKRLVILDGERRWRCAKRLGLRKVPVIVQPEPTKMANIMMMFAIHNARKDWDPLPTALKLQQLEKLYYKAESRNPTEGELAQIASMTKGEVRRLKTLLNLPQKYLDKLMVEGEKPRSEQMLTVDHVIEATRGVSALRKRGLVDVKGEERLRAAIVTKYQSGVIRNTVEPRQLSRIARAVERNEISKRSAKKIIDRLIVDDKYSILSAFNDSVARLDFEHSLEQQAIRLSEKLLLEAESGNEIGDTLRDALKRLSQSIRRLTSN